MAFKAWEAVMNNRFIAICVVVLLWVGGLLYLGRTSNSRDAWAMMLIGSSLITFFGILHNIADEIPKLEARIRLAICATLVVAYLVYFGSVVYLEPALDDKGNRIKTFADEIFPTLTTLVTVAVSFYFGSTAAIQISKNNNPSAAP